MKKILVLTSFIFTFAAFACAADTCACTEGDLFCKNQCAKETVNAVKGQVKQDANTAKTNIQNAQKSWSEKAAQSQKESAAKNEEAKQNLTNY